MLLHALSVRNQLTVTQRAVKFHTIFEHITLTFFFIIQSFQAKHHTNFCYSAARLFEHFGREKIFEESSFRNAFYTR